MRIFIQGGSKNGKSSYAEQLAKAQSKGKLYYIATMKPVDDEDVERIKNHQNSRSGMGFDTVEYPQNIIEVLRDCDTKGSFLLDSTTALLANEMFQGKEFIKAAGEAVGEQIKTLIRGIEDIVIVSDAIFSDAEEFDDYTRAYQKGLAYVDRCCAKECDVVIESCYHQMILHKGEIPDCIRDRIEEVGA